MMRFALTFLFAISSVVNPCFAQAPGNNVDDVARPGRLLVMPFENVKRDGSIFWLGEASSVLLTDDLNAFGLNAITRPERSRPNGCAASAARATRTASAMPLVSLLVGLAPRA